MGAHNICELYIMDSEKYVYRVYLKMNSSKNSYIARPSLFVLPTVDLIAIRGY